MLASILIFLGSRLVMVLAIACASRWLPPNPVTAYWNVNLPGLNYLLRWDAQWYLTIAEQGYHYNGNNFIEHPVVFYPLYPLIAKGVELLFHIPVAISLLLVSNLASLIAIVALFKLIQQEFGVQTARYAIALLSVYPTSLFFSAAYTESLSLVLIVAFFWSLRQERYIVASIVSGFTLATRSSGIALLLPLVWQLWTQFQPKWPLKEGLSKQFISKLVVCLLLATAGLWLYMLYLGIAFNSPFALIAAQQAWRQEGVGSNLLQVLTLQPLRHHLGTIFQPGAEIYHLDPWFFLLFVGISIRYWQKLPIAYNLYGIGVLLLPYLTLSGSSLGFTSFTRYIMLSFPVFIGLGKLWEQQAWLGWTLLSTWLILLTIYTARFSQWYWVA
jgi:Gpi18-like mannosyltransferase